MKKDYSVVSVLSVLCLFSCVNLSVLVNPVLANIASETFPDLPYSTVTYLSTIVNLMCLVTTLISGAIAGTKVKFRTLAVIGFVVMAVAGIIPAFVSTFAVVLLSRALVGLGQGLVQPMGNTVCLRVFKGEKATSVQGIGNIVSNGLGIAFQFAATALVLINIRYLWMVHLVTLIPAALVALFMPEPETDPQAAADNAGKTEKKEGLGFTVYYVTFSFCLMFLVYYPLLLNASTIVESEGLGNGTMIAVLCSLYTVGGMVGGAIYSKLYSASGRMFIPITACMWVVGMAMASFVGNIWIMMIGTLLTGIAIFTLWPGSIALFAKKLSPDNLGRASAFFVAVFSLSAFLSTPYSSLVGKLFHSAAPRLPLQVGVVIMAVDVAIWMVYYFKTDGRK